MVIFCKVTPGNQYYRIVTSEGNVTSGNMNEVNYENMDGIIKQVLPL